MTRMGARKDCEIDRKLFLSLLGIYAMYDFIFLLHFAFAGLEIEHSNQIFVL